MFNVKLLRFAGYNEKCLRKKGGMTLWDEQMKQFEMTKKLLWTFVTVK